MISSLFNLFVFLCHNLHITYLGDFFKLKFLVMKIQFTTPLSTERETTVTKTLGHVSNKSIYKIMYCPQMQKTLKLKMAKLLYIQDFL